MPKFEAARNVVYRRVDAVVDDIRTDLSIVCTSQPRSSTRHANAGTAGACYTRGSRYDKARHTADTPITSLEVIHLLQLFQLMLVVEF